MVVNKQAEIRVLIVDDSSFLRRTLPSLLESDPDIKVIGTACDGQQGLDMAKRLRPDVITLDVLMPVMDGLTALKRIMSEVPTPVLMVSSLTTRGSRQTVEALSLGAVDYLPKPSGPSSLDIDRIKKEFIHKIKTVASAKIPSRVKPHIGSGKIVSSYGPIVFDAPRSQNIRLVAIAASTGGPAALQVLLSGIPENFPAGMVIIQHIAKGFTSALAERLNNTVPLEIRVCEDFERIRPGSVLLAPTGRHLRVKHIEGGFYATLTVDPADTLYRPSADILFSSIAKECGAQTCAVIMTGMGRDGAHGIKEIKAAGGITMAQDETSSVIFGMPGAAIKTGGVDRIVPLNYLAQEIRRVVAPSTNQEETLENNRIR